MGPTHLFCRRMILAGAKILANMCMLLIFHDLYCFS